MRSVALLASAAALLAAAPALAGDAGLRRLALKSTQVGAGYKRQTIPQGTQVKHQITLDLCGHKFATERLRTARLQVYIRRNRHVPTVGNEVVRYRAGGAQKALAEAATVAAHCPKHAVKGPVAGVGPVRYRLKQLTVPGTLPGTLALRIRTFGRIAGKHVDHTSFAVYQVAGDVLSAVYVAGGTMNARQALAFAAAAQSAANLTAG
jgi:hypothetical protein